MKNDENEPIGILLVNKPKGWTSFDVCGRLRGILHTKRIGHAGTLDPMAEGVLPVLVGKAAKAADILPESGKVYRAGFKLGIRTDTQDISGEVTDTSDTAVSCKELEAALESFVGDYMQVPPMYSAVKVDGRKLYEYAREGREIKREGRLRHIDFIKLIQFDEAKREGVIELSVSRGTYVRTLIDDLGAALSSFGTMTSLVRVNACGFDINSCLTIEQIEKAAYEGRISEILTPLDEIFASLRPIRLDERKTVLYKNGVKFRPEQVGIRKITDGERFRVTGHDNKIIAVAYTDKAKNELRALRNFY